MSARASPLRKPAFPGSRVGFIVPLRSYALETKYELYRLLRTPGFAVPALLFPVMFYALFGLLLAPTPTDAYRATYLFATYGVFGAMAPGLFGFGMSLAFEREQRLFVLKRALPMPIASYLVSRMLMAMAFVTVVFVSLVIVALLSGTVRLTVGQYFALAAVDILGVLPFCALGLYIGAIASGQAAQAFVNLAYLPMAFLSGLWIPLSNLPALLSEIAPVWPSYHLAQIALQVAGFGTGRASVAFHIGVLVSMTLLLFWFARRRLSRMDIS